jgi:hypothetical protein
MLLDDKLEKNHLQNKSGGGGVQLEESQISDLQWADRERREGRLRHQSLEVGHLASNHNRQNLL